MRPLQPYDVGIGQLFWSIRDAVVVGDARTGRIVLWSPSAASMFGYAEAEALGLSIEALVPQQFQAQHRAGLARYSVTGHGALIDSNAPVEVSARRKTGEEIVVELTLTPVEQAPSSEDSLVLALIRDVTERKRAERAQLQLAREQAARLAAEAAEEQQRLLALENARLYQQAQDAIHVRDEFLSVASHELKTPITSLQGFAQLLLRRLDKGGTVDSGDLRRGLDVITMQADKLARLVSQLLDISRLEAGKLVLDRSTTDVTALVERVAAGARMAAHRHDLTVHAAAPVTALVDPLRLEQVVANLVDNAIKYSPAGGPIVIEVAHDEPETGEPDTVRIVVQDRGIGIPPQQQQQIFERFYQAHAHDYRSGMGLGLYICRQIVDLHGGSIAIDSLADHGTRVTIRLPQGG